MERCKDNSRFVIEILFFLLKKVNLIKKKSYPNCVCVIYTGDTNATPEEFIKKANERFKIELSPVRTRFVYLRLRFLVLDKYYPIFTLLGNFFKNLFFRKKA